MASAGPGEPWVILEKRYGADVRSPSPEELACAIDELYVENLPGMTQGDYEEHGSACLRYGYHDRPMYVLEVSRLGTVSFEEWADQDYETELTPPRESHSVTRDRALQLWRWLASGELENVRNHAWDS